MLECEDYIVQHRKISAVCREIARYKILILGISEREWTASGQVRTQAGESIVYNVLWQK